MWNPLAWICRRRKTPNLPDELVNGDEVHRARVEAEQALDYVKHEADKVDRLVRRTSPMRRDQFAEDLKRAFGT